MTDLPRVTEILQPFSGYDSVDPGILMRAAARGTRVHAICAGEAKGAWVPDSMIEAELLGYVQSYRKWKEAQVKSFLLIEKRFQDEVAGFTGQLDFLVEGSDGRTYLVDLKTSSRPQKTYPLQMAAYKYLLEQHGIEVFGTILVYLDKEGEFPDINIHYDLAEEKRIFFSALECYKYFHKKKERKNAKGTRKEEPEPKITSDNERTGLHSEGLEAC